MSTSTNRKRSDIADPDKPWFTGEKKTLAFEIFEADGVTMKNVSGIDGIRWSLRKSARPLDPHRVQAGEEFAICTKAGGQIVVSGTFNSVRATNAQRVYVTVPAAATEGVIGGRYRHSLLDEDDDEIWSYGIAELFVASTL